MNGTVYISSEPPAARSDRDFSSAARYGTLKFVLPTFPFPSAAPGPAMITARKALAEFDSDKDYVAFGGGDPMSLLIVGATLADMGVPAVNILRWERSRNPEGERTGTGFYLPSRVPLRMTALPKPQKGEPE